MSDEKSWEAVDLDRAVKPYGWMVLKEEDVEGGKEYTLSSTRYGKYVRQIPADEKNLRIVCKSMDHQVGTLITEGAVYTIRVTTKGAVPTKPKALVPPQLVPLAPPTHIPYGAPKTWQEAEASTKAILKAMYVGTRKEDINYLDLAAELITGEEGGKQAWPKDKIAEMQKSLSAVYTEEQRRRGE